MSSSIGHVSERPYHHGHLREAVVAAALTAIEEDGVAALSVRDVARRADVTHTSVAYHFGDKTGLLTAIAIDGFRLLRHALDIASHSRDLLAMGVAYVTFAADHPAHFDVMFQSSLLHTEDPDLVAARAETSLRLHGADDVPIAVRAYGIAAWSMVHGIATLHRNGALPAELGDDPEAITRAIAIHLGRRPRISRT
jgi:AcrR family transcriptional regulator